MKLINILTEGKYESDVLFLARTIFGAVKNNSNDFKFGFETGQQFKSPTLRFMYKPLKWGMAFLKCSLSVETYSWNEINPDAREEAKKFGCVVNGTFSPDSGELSVEVMILPSFTKEFANRLLYSIKNTLRHELEHFDQFTSGKPRSIGIDIQNKMNYLQKTIFQVTGGQYSGHSGRLLQMGPGFVHLQIPGITRPVAVSTANISKWETTYKYLTKQLEVEAFVAGLYKEAKTRKIPFTKLLNDFLNTGDSNKMTPQEKKLVYSLYYEYAKKRFPNIK